MWGLWIEPMFLDLSDKYLYLLYDPTGPGYLHLMSILKM